MIRLVILTFTLGAAWLQSRPVLPVAGWVWLPALGLLAFLLYWSRGRRSGIYRLGILALAFVTGFLYAGWRAELRLAGSLPEALSGLPVTLTGRIIDLPQTTPRGWRAVLEVSQVDTPGVRVPGRIQFGHSGHGSRPDHPVPKAGACIRATVRLQPPHGQINPHGFDYEGWLLQQGIVATGTLAAPVAPAQGCTGGLRAQVDRLRDRIRDHLRTSLADRPYAGVVIALALGDQKAIPAGQWTLFRHTGVTHLMSISGLHVTLFSSLVYLLVSRLWRRLPTLCLHLPAHKAGLALGLLAAAGYVALAGFGIPAQRTLYMLAAVAAGLWGGARLSPSRILAAALLTVVAIDPWAALAPGFWLSFGAVAVLFYFGSARLMQAPWWQAWGHAQWAVTVGLTPALLALFHEVSLVSPLANAFAIPLISLLAVPLTLLAALLPWEPLAWAAHAVVQFAMTGLEWLDALPQPVWYGARPAPLALGLALLGAAWLLLPGGVPARWLGAALFLPLLFPRLERPAEGEFWVDVLDVGQGLAAVVRTAGRVLVYDVGPLYASGEGAGSRVVAPYLHAQGLRRVDMLVISHDDTDHSGGALGLAATHPPRAVLTSLAGLAVKDLDPHGRAVLAALPQARACVAGQRWQWDGVAFEVLHPSAGHYRAPGYADNALSCVLKVSSPAGSMLLTGDAERQAERAMLQQAVQSLPSQVLLIAHHGSRTSTTPDFLDAVSPRLAVIPVGHRNRYGHPAPEVLARLQRRGISVARTDREGAILLRFSRDGIQVRRAREAHRRYWHRPLMPTG